MDKDRLRKIDIAKVTGISSRTIANWTAKGYLIPKIKAEGQGKISYYDAENAVHAKLLQEFSEMGITLELIANQLNEGRLGNLDPFKKDLENEKHIFTFFDCTFTHPHYIPGEKDMIISSLHSGINSFKEKAGLDFLVNGIFADTYNFFIAVNIKKIMKDVKEAIEAL